MAKMYVTQEMIDIPMPRILADYGIQLSYYGKFKLRDERTASAKYYEKTNTFYDFGAGIGGSNINLIMALQQCDKKTARGILGEDYGLTEWRAGATEGLTISQWESIGIYGRMASMNWAFDMDRPMEELHALSVRLGSFTMNRLREERPEEYVAILRNRAIPFVAKERESYLDALRRPFGKHEPNTQKYLESQASAAAVDYSAKHGVLVKAVKGTKIDVRHLRPDYDRDLQALRKEIVSHRGEGCSSERGGMGME